MSAHPTFPTGEPVSIIGSRRFHFSVRNGKRWDTPELSTDIKKPLGFLNNRVEWDTVPLKVSIGMVGGIISTPWLKPLLALHLEPINVVVFDEITHT